MSIPMHIIDVGDGSSLSGSDRVSASFLPAIAMGAGTAAGAAVSTTVTGHFPATYGVHVDPGQDATWYTTNHTAKSFVLVCAPRLAATTLSAATMQAATFG